MKNNHFIYIQESQDYRVKGFFIALLLGFFGMMLPVLSFAQVRDMVYIEMMDETHTITVDHNIQQIVIENSSIIKVDQNEYMLTIIPLKMGKTVVYTWDDQQNMNAFPIYIVPQGYLNAVNFQEKMASKTQSDSNHLKISFNNIIGNSQNQIASSNYVTNWGVYQLGFMGDSNFGQYNSFVQFEQRNTYTDLATASGNVTTQNAYLTQMVLASFQLTNPAFSLSAGDSWAQISPLVSNYLHYQGAQLTNVNFYGFHVNLYSGGTHQYFWGQDLWKQPSTKYFFGGLQVKKDIFSQLTIYGNQFLIEKSEVSSSVTTKTQYSVSSLGGLYSMNPISLQSEFAMQSNGGKGFVFQAKYNSAALFSSLEYRTIDSTYTSFSDNALNDVQGLYYDISYSPLLGWNLYGKLNRYKRPSLSEEFFYEKGVGVRFNQNKYLPHFDIGYWEYDRKAIPQGGIHRGYQIYASQYLFYIPTTMYIYYRPIFFEAEAVPSLNSDVTTVILGLNNQLLDYGNLILEGKREIPKSSSSGSQTTSYVLNIVSQPIQFFTLDFVNLTVDFSGKIEKHYTEEFNDYNLYYADSTLRVQQPIFDSVYLNFSKSINKSSNQEETNIRFGLQTVFDTGLNLANRVYKVKGVVFEDKNQNGKKDSNEPVLSGFQISNGNNTVTTDKKGAYVFNFVNNPYLSIFSSTYDRYRVLINNPYQVTLPAYKDVELDIPVVLLKEVQVIAFFDANNDGVYDGSFDQLISNVKFVLTKSDGTTIKSILSTTGKEKFELSASETSDLKLSVDITSVSNQLIPENAQGVSQVPSSDQIYFPFILK